MPMHLIERIISTSLVDSPSTRRPLGSRGLTIDGFSMKLAPTGPETSARVSNGQRGQSDDHGQHERPCRLPTWAFVSPVIGAFELPSSTTDVYTVTCDTRDLSRIVSRYDSAGAIVIYSSRCRDADCATHSSYARPPRSNFTPNRRITAPRSDTPNAPMLKAP